MEKIPEDILKRQMTDLLFERDYEILLEQIKMVKKENRARNKKRRKG